MYTSLLLVLSLASTPASTPAAEPTLPLLPQTLKDVLELVAEDDVAAHEIVYRVDESGLYVSLTPEQIVRLYFDQRVPAVVLAALVENSGAAHPVIVERGKHLDLGFDGYRIVGRRGTDGPVLMVTGYGGDGARLKPAVESAPEPARAAPPRSATRTEIDVATVRRAERESVRRLDEARVELQQATARLEAETSAARAAQAASVTNAVVNPFAQPGVYYDAYGAPLYVTVSQVPAAYLRSGRYQRGGTAPGLGLGFYGYGQSTTQNGYGVLGFGRAAGADCERSTSVSYQVAPATKRGSGQASGRTATSPDTRGRARRQVVRDRVN
jgi:hypothetical protein